MLFQYGWSMSEKPLVGEFEYCSLTLDDIDKGYDKDSNYGYFVEVDGRRSHPE